MMKIRFVIGIIFFIVLFSYSQGVIWSDDFEGYNDLSSKYQDVSTNGFSINSKDPCHGESSLEQRYEQGQVNAGWISIIDDENELPEHLFMRWYHKFEAGFQEFPPKMARIRNRHHYGDWASEFSVHFWIENNVIVADILSIHSSQANSTNWLPITKSEFSFADPQNVGVWICFEMEVKLNTPGMTDGECRFWANDEIIIEKTGLDIRGSSNKSFNEAMLDCYWNGGSPVEQCRYYDDFVISTEKIGPISENSNMLDFKKKVNNDIIIYNQTGEVEIKLNHYFKNPRVKIISLNGKIIKDFSGIKIINSKTKISVIDVPSGSYLISVYDSNKIFMIRSLVLK